MTRVTSVSPSGLEVTPRADIARSALADEWTKNTVIEAPLPLGPISFFAQRYDETKNGCYAIAAIQEARGRIDEPWLQGFLSKFADAIMSGLEERGDDTLTAAIAKALDLPIGKGKNAVEKTMIEIRNHNIFNYYERLSSSNKMGEEDIVEMLSAEFERDEKTIRNIIAMMRGARKFP